MKKSLSKSEAQKQIKEFFSNVKNKTPREIRKIKRLAMSYNIPLKEKRKLFCKKCLNPYSEKERVRIRKGFKLVVCGSCRSIAKWKIA